jgi:proteic killer suppression protein
MGEGTRCGELVDIRFRTKELRKCFEHSKEAVKRFGEGVARRYIERVGILANCKSAADLSGFPSLKFHPLKGDRAGQYGITLVGRTRMVVKFEDKAMEVVCIEEVGEHYGD